MLPNGATLEWTRLFIRDSDEQLVEPPDSETLRQRLNLASCTCSKAGDAHTDLYYELHLSATTLISPPGQLFVGAGCEDDITRPLQCRQVGDIADLDALNVREASFPIHLFDLINATPTQATEDCRQANGGSAFAWVLSDTNNDSDPDFFSPRPIDLAKFTDVMGFDTQPPPLPENLTATGGEESIELKWETPLSNATDLFAFQALCISGGAAVRAADAPLYTTTQTICDTEQRFDLAATDLSSVDGTPVDALPEPFAVLDPSFLCGTVENGTAQSLRIEGLNNNTEYTIALVAVDFYGNAAGAYFTRTVVPKPVTDLWEDIHDRGGTIEGGFCAATGSAPSLVLVLGVVAWLWFRRRSSSVVAVASVAVLGAIIPSAARADDFSPYWENPTTEDNSVDADAPKWHAGIKLGPYTPAIDEQLGNNARSGLGPYEAMFGNYWVNGEQTDTRGVYQILPVLDVDRFLWSGSGQFGVGGSIGYMQKTAYAYAQSVEGDVDTTADSPRRERSTAANNTFRLIPLALTATYRATQLDDLYGIPIVPYLRGGLSYYIWWMKGPNGDVSKVCKDGSMDEGCEANKAYGGTLGFQGSIGLAVRAERIDPSAARSMVQSGIHHAGFYAELMVAVVNGFGSDKKLSVGDRTWFAGMDFEF